MRTLDQMIAQEIHYCVSSLVSTLAAGCDFTDRANDAGRDLQVVCEQAFELAGPIDDWEEAARQEGFEMSDGGVREPSEEDPDTWDTWQEACEARGIEPYQREVFEHWIVSDWLADKLAEHGEKVDKDFAGMTVWARTTSGQGIASDSVMEAIYAELMA
mgnify:CR=1 FL=1|tara:strand:+ start:11999 stop:12475 length:477 start_codon:yes stop_codon:yes gene_type:complete